jgi:hypothetical protein
MSRLSFSVLERRITMTAKRPAPYSSTNVSGRWTTATALYPGGCCAEPGAGKIAPKVSPRRIRPNRFKTKTLCIWRSILPPQNPVHQFFRLRTFQRSRAVRGVLGAHRVAFQRPIPLLPDPGVKRLSLGVGHNSHSEDETIAAIGISPGQSPPRTNPKPSASIPAIWCRPRWMK